MIPWIFVFVGACMIFWASRIGSSTSDNDVTIGESTVGNVAKRSFGILARIWLYLFGSIFLLGGLANVI